MSNATMPVRTASIRKAVKGKRKARPTWEMVDYFPKQSEWTEFEFLNLPEDGPRAELVDGYLEMLPMPSYLHQQIAIWMFLKLNAFLDLHSLGQAFYDGTRLKLGDRRIRLPDITVLLKEKRKQHNDESLLAADLVLEIVSGGSKDRNRDLIVKRDHYAEASIPEYWILDPEREQITVLKLSGNTYEVHGEFKKGQTATSALLAGFEVDVSEALAGRQ